MRWFAMVMLGMGLLVSPAWADAPHKLAEDRAVTRSEFVQAVGHWIHAYEQLAHKSLKHPKETILLYLDLNDGSVRDTALDLEKNYRLFEGVDEFHYGLFEPDVPMTRLQAAQILRNVVGLVESNTKARVTLATPKEFQDHFADPVDQQAVSELSARAIFHGFRDATFQPAQKLTHHQFELLQADFLHYLDVSAQKP